MRTRTLLLLYPGSVRHRQELMRRHGAGLRARGIRTVLADDWIDPGDPAHFDAVVAVPPPEHVAAVLDRLLAVPCDAVLAQTESALLPGALLCARLGLRGMPLPAALASVHKHRTRTVLARAGVPQPEFALARDAAGVRRFAAGSYPVVLKAVASAMSRGVTLVRDDAAVDGAVARLRALLPRAADIARMVAFAEASGQELDGDPRQDFLVERFAAGDPVETDGLVVGDRVECYGVTAQQMAAPPLFYIEGYLLPSGRGDEAVIRAAADGALRALGVRDTGYSVELRAAASGARVIEVNGRLGEDDAFGELFFAATGSEPFLDAVALALGEQPRLGAAQGDRCALAYRCSFVDGVVRSIPAIAATAAPGVQLGLCVEPGTRMHAPPHPDTFPHLAWALVRDPASGARAYAAARAAVDALPFAVE